jgi:hypothetical protein
MTLSSAAIPDQAGAVREAVARGGYCLLPDLLPEETVALLLAALAQAVPAAAARRRGGEVFAIRNLLRDMPLVRRLADLTTVRAGVEAVLGSGAFPVRGILFDKTPAANWKVGWHQDSMIPVKRRREVSGFCSWSVKAGVPHVLPPARVLAGMLHARIHLDPCGEENGPLLVKPGSHGHGRLSDRTRAAWVRDVGSVPCLVPRGGILLMRPLLLHASSAARVPGHRRVIHLEFAAAPLPGGLEWAES